MMMRTTTLVRLRNRGGEISPSDDVQFVAAAVRGPGVAKPLFVPVASSATALFFAFTLSLAPFHDPVGALVSTLVGASFAVLACWPELEARRRLPRFVKRLATVAAAALLIAPAIAVARVENEGAAAAGPGGEAPLYALPAKWRLAADASCPPALAEAANWSCDADEFYAFSRRPSPGGEGEEEAFVLAPRCGGEESGSSGSGGGSGNDGDGIGGALSGTPPTEGAIALLRAWAGEEILPAGEGEADGGGSNGGEAGASGSASARATKKKPPRGGRSKSSLDEQIGSHYDAVVVQVARGSEETTARLARAATRFAESRRARGDPARVIFLGVPHEAHAGTGPEATGEAVEWARRELERDPRDDMAYRTLAASYAQLGRLEEARKALEEELRLEPDLSLRKVREQNRATDADFLARWLGGLRKAGLKEE